MVYAAWDARLSKPDAKGVPARVHYETIAKKRADSPFRRKALKALTAPEFPERIRYLWNWFHELLAARRYTEFGPVALSYPDVDAWARLTERRPNPDEVRALFALDRITRHPPEELA